MLGNTLTDMAMSCGCKGGPAGLQPFLKLGRDVKEAKWVSATSS